MSDPIHNTGAGAASVLYDATPPDTGTRKDPQATAPPAPDFAAQRAELDRKREAIATEAETLRTAERKAAENVEQPESAADKLFGSPESLASSYGPQLADSLNDLVALLPPEAAELREEILRDTASAFADAALPPEQASVVHAAFVSALRNPPGDDLIATWERESREWLAANYAQGHESELARVRQFVDARPGLKQLLEVTGLGSNPRIVAALMQNANQLRLTPRKR